MAGALTDAVWIFAAFLVLIVAAAVAIATRRFLLERSGGTVECALRFPAGTGNWRLGLLSYQRDELYWHGALGVLLSPEQVFQRRALSVVSRRPVALEETSALGADRIVVEVAVKPSTDASGSRAGEHLELAMSDAALTGFLAWLEASPPGSHLEDFALPQNQTTPRPILNEPWRTHPAQPPLAPAPRFTMRIASASGDRRGCGWWSGGAAELPALSSAD